MSSAIQGVGTAVLFVRDLQRSRAFYTDVLGLDVDAESVGLSLEDLHFTLLQVDCASMQLQGEATTTPTEGATAFTSFTDDVDALHADLEGRCVDFFQQLTDQRWGTRTAYFKDPDGHVWELAQAIERSKAWVSLALDDSRTAAGMLT